MEHTYTKMYFLLLVWKFKFNWSPVFLIANSDDPNRKAPSFHGWEMILVTLQGTT